MNLSAQLLASLDDDHLIASMHQVFDPLTSTPAEVELLKRFESIIDDSAANSEIAEAADEFEFTADHIRKFGEVASENVEDTFALLEALYQADITNVTDWNSQRALLDALAEAGIESVEQLQACGALAEQFRSLMSDAGDVFTRLSQLAKTTQE